MVSPATRAPALDEAAFRHFAPLLRASQDYASHSGCRFRAGSFDGLPTVASNDSSIPASVSAARSRDPGPRLAAKLSAAPVVAEFGARLKRGEPELAEEVERAYRIVMVESVRNAMAGMFQALEMYPPSPPPPDVDDEDCAYEDVSAPLPVVAQRLYNDQVRRVSDTSGGPGRLDKRAMTAAYIVDFAEVLGVPLPTIPETQRDMLQELSARIAEETQRRGTPQHETERVRDVFLNGFGAGAAAENLRQEASKWWAENWKAVAWSVAGAAVVGVAALAASALSARAERGRRSSEGRGEFR